ncbi:N-acetyl-1-D-myo-inositol-2-amino-2-deoxy-alpha-D-glucopyranoside deacetylase [Streptomyces spiramenti]|uniref:1D-myo-inositol 2-acetamido-2-deoxy-alpha-D-glucopyranoside deacetylase n=1 Tax=Streptomyces spiramenti TaxID=2720606 RepID=A0ABX1APG1_9ACTN|nr:N-acetyl-1-D-myo-inositol-2-amino-2-deoxy-alpha-D-glucopyranoside deacetylase [Streptomyces spiramenti]NJP67288.1 N-acetyl-1-D-myo-inositol-2-amino-2-deoxy-alpha-D-glucopyranoside deacetylase [Streptomyces spiramenti]
MSDGPPGVLLVHAHPDDESINNGVTMAACVELGVPVTLVTCTRGEEGEVIPAPLAALTSEREDRLGAHRVAELAEAMAELGVSDHRFLTVGGETPRDSGMMGLPHNERPGAFWGTDLDRAAVELAAVIRETRPGTVITYDPDGGYGHPDHIQAHRVATRAVELAAAEGPPGARAGVPAAAAPAAPHRVARVLWNSVPRTAAESALARLRESGPRGDAGTAGPGGGPAVEVASLADIPGVVDDTAIDWRVVGSDRQVSAKAAAMRAHRTQVTVVPSRSAAPETEFVLSNFLLQPLWSTEWYRLAAGEPFGAVDAGPFLPPGGDTVGDSGVTEAPRPGPVRP